MKPTRLAVLIAAAALSALVLVTVVLVSPAWAKKVSPAAALVTSISSSNGTAVEVEWSGLTSLVYIVQSASDVVSGVWGPLATGSYGNSGFGFVDTNLTGAFQRFYRLQWAVNTNDTTGPSWPGGAAPPESALP